MIKKKTIGGQQNFVLEMKCVENYPDFEKLTHVIQCGLQGFKVKNIEVRWVNGGKRFNSVFFNAVTDQL